MFHRKKSVSEIYGKGFEKKNVFKNEHSKEVGPLAL